MSRLEWVLVTLLALLVVAISAMALLVWSGQMQEDPAVASNEALADSEPAEVLHTAKSAYEQAEPVALQWAEDAQLLTARASWPQGAEIKPRSAAWGYLFYSPTNNATALISVSGSQSRIVRTGRAEKKLEPLTIGAWQVDSPAVLEQLMTSGGQKFLETHGQASLSLTLRAVDAFEWQARFIDPEQNAVFTLDIDPVSGVVTAVNNPEEQG